MEQIKINNSNVNGTEIQDLIKNILSKPLYLSLNSTSDSYLMKEIILPAIINKFPLSDLILLLKYHSIYLIAVPFPENNQNFNLVSINPNLESKFKISHFLWVCLNELEYQTFLQKHEIDDCKNVLLLNCCTGLLKPKK
jgi:hypothetical protein